jgi:hypothetical protein
MKPKNATRLQTNAFSYGERKWCKPLRAKIISYFHSDVLAWGGLGILPGKMFFRVKAL